jgi:hypothetical protein
MEKIQTSIARGTKGSVLAFVPRIFLITAHRVANGAALERSRTVRAF